MLVLAHAEFWSALDGSRMRQSIGMMECADPKKHGGVHYSSVLLVPAHAGAACGGGDARASPNSWTQMERDCAAIEDVKSRERLFIRVHYVHSVDSCGMP
jgi:hypothetical protein